MPHRQTDAVTLTTGPAERTLLIVGLPLLGALAGWLLLLAAEPARHAPVGVVRALARALTDLPPGWALAVALAAGTATGIALTVAAERDRSSVTVGPAEVVVRRDGRTQVVERGRVGAVFLDGHDLVVADATSADVLRERTDVSRDRLASAFSDAGYPWRPGGDPRAAEFRRWVAPTPDLPVGAALLLAARAAAVRAKRADDARDLRAELARVGVVVRDADGQQWWRVVSAR